MEGILRWCLAQRDDEIVETSEEVRQLSQEERAWLLEAIKSFTVDLLDTVKANVEIIKNENATEEEKLTALESVHDIVVDLDNARDLHLIGGFEPIVALMGDESAAVRAAAADVVGTVTQNNPVCQKFAQELNVLDKTVPLISDANATVQAKAIRAASCMIRRAPALFKNFMELRGFARLFNALDSDSVPVRIKILFLARSLFGEYPPVITALVAQDDFAVLHKIIAALRNPEDESSDVWEHGLFLLVDLCKQSPDILRECATVGLDKMVQTRIEFINKQSDQGPYEEQIESSHDLLKLLG